VADVESVQVRGLEGLRLRDKLTRIEAEESSLPVRLAGPMDRVYMDVPGPVRVVDQVACRTLRVELEGFRDAVVWNPWEEGSREFDDMDLDEWRGMLCVEPAVAAAPLELAPGARWTGSQRLVAE
jgi:glucose-6-phosphate 1-epimerase